VVVVTGVVTTVLTIPVVVVVVCFLAIFWTPSFSDALFSVVVDFVTGRPGTGTSETITASFTVTAVETSEVAITEELTVPFVEVEVTVGVPSTTFVVPSALYVVVTGVDVVVVVMTGVVSRIVSV